MKQMIIIPKFHSVIDVITNSSTELFITDKNQNVAAIQEFLVRFSQLMDEEHGVGEIFELTESNIGDFIKRNYYYVNFGFNHSIEDEWAFINDYFAKKGWDKVNWGNRTEEDKRRYEEARDAYDKEINALIEKNMGHLKKEWVGRIVIEGSSSNSIPYSIWDLINNKFNATNYHLG